VAHDFNNLLMVVSGHTQLLKERMAGDTRVVRSIEAIETAAARGETLTRQLLTFSRRHAVTPTVFALNARLDGFRSMMSSSLGAGVQLTVAVDPAAWPVKVDPNEFELALVNIALNARDAMPDGGVIALTAENVALAGSETLAQIAGDFVALRIADTGAGIAPDLLPKVFEPFFTTKPAEKGSGLGLSQVYGFAHQSGGTVTIESEIGKGTMVTLYLPRAAEEPEQVEEPSAIESLPGGTVLLVEDNPEVAEVTTAMLEELAYKVRCVGDAEAALAAVEQEPVDLVITDIVMAGPMDGLALARALRERRPELPVLLVTGYSKALGEASDHFVLLRKPFRLGDLSRIVASMIAEAGQPPGSNVVRLRGRHAAGGMHP
ncbi:MAG: response regulator, partial [Alphaproteobacteria bacterium]|nr:response regulator [Alphaproteobacteria bacterium]